MHKPSSLNDYIIAFLLSLFLTLVLGTYLYLRRGFMLDVPVGIDTLYVPNKVLGNVGMMIIALSFLFGPITRYFNRLDTFIGCRKEIGIVGAFILIFHGVISYFYLPKRYPNEYIDFSSLEFSAGLLGAFVLLFLFIISFKKAIEIIGAGRWWFLQRFGLRVVVLFTLVHVALLKWSGWVSWFTEGFPVSKELVLTWLPAVHLLTFLFIVWVVAIRIYESIFLFQDFGWKTKEISMDPVLRARGRSFFITSFFVLLFLYILIFLRFLF